MVKSKLILSAFAAMSLMSCNKSTSAPDKPIVEYIYWGEEIIYNDSSNDIKVSITDQNDDVLEWNLPSSAKDTLLMPNDSYFICIDVCKKVAITDGDNQVVLEKGESEWFKSYEYEEKDYWITIYGKKYLAENKWPIYRYHIDDALLGIAGKE